MRTGEPSTTALYVALGRAAAHRRAAVKGFSDPVAIRLLPERYVAALERAERGTPPSWRERRFRWLVSRLTRWAPLRTLAIDDALRGSLGQDAQVVILGAGLDARAWRMPELAGSVVYEVDHPATQRYKRERVASLRPAAREVRFVPVDFEREPFPAKLAEAGHEAARPTAWIWEGVVMYLLPGVVEATVRLVAERSAPGSRLLASYATPSLRRAVVGLFLARLGEPFRSAFTPRRFAELLGRSGFSVLSDDGVADWARRYAGQGARPARIGSSQRLAVAERSAGRA
ncbi:MAG TPA: SAM-dependent methyltransferase [Anaeromyxobacter sp.]